MYRTTPLDTNLPSPYELLFGRKSKTFLPNASNTLLSKHPDSDTHRDSLQSRQEDQAAHYNTTAGNDLRVLKDNEPVYVRNTLTNTWELGTVLNRPNPEREPRTYLIQIKGRLCQRPRQPLKPRNQPTSDLTIDRTVQQNSVSDKVIENQKPCSRATGQHHRQTTRRYRYTRPLRGAPLP